MSIKLMNIANPINEYCEFGALTTKPLNIP